MKIIKSNFSSTAMFVLLLLPLVFTSCDPALTLKIENKTNADAKVKFGFKHDRHYYKFDEFTQKDTLIVTLDSTAQNRIREYRFGIGTWAIQSSFDSLIAMVDWVEVVTWKSTETYQGATQIREFFKSRITGRKKESIVVNLE